jgi:N-acetylmuramoyl-L-alanine amidase
MLSGYLIMIILTSAICLAINTYHEARGATISEQIKVTNVAINRSINGNYCAAVFKPGAFSWINKPFKDKFNNYSAMLKYYNVDDLNAYFNAVQAATIAQLYQATSANYYTDKSIKKPKWAKAMHVTNTTLNFIFYRGN